MEPSDPSFADKFNVPQEYAVIVIDERRAEVSLPFQVHRLKALVEAGLAAFSSVCFELRTKSQKKVSTAALRTFRRFFQPSSRPFEGYCYGVLRVGAYSPPLSAAMLRSSQPPHRAPRTNPVLRAGA